ncbi:serine/threonine protein kinase [Saprolegnia diclina VS20]|uniref:Serine/threonine protein kinase n=1 Tax=Saprolegnia diclina (strain VS20) TaxID=1156394 RepID=T0RJ92_SAPDV|nr:serine/threonine protein kinase [Saprolegnia diclina VS20]EQC29952.1 serine/threonine protein kinase [Saprolegnia diclina VS20]|eukprot:XP_008616519.1 serine/threonine protein kinase [Saprolegnia diclina VS20]
MAFLADLKRSNGKANPLLSGGVGMGNPSRTVDSLKLAERWEERRRLGLPREPATSAIEILLELEAKQEEDERLRGHVMDDDDAPPIPDPRKAASRNDSVQQMRRSSEVLVGKKSLPPAKNPTLEEMMKCRQATAGSSAPPRNATLEKMMMTRNASKGGDASKKLTLKDAMREAMTMKRAPRTVGAPSPIVEEAPTSRNAMLEAMMKKRAATVNEPPAPTPPAPTPPSSGGSMNTMLEEMMKMRAPPVAPASGGDGKTAVFADAAALPLGVGADTSDGPSVLHNAATLPDCDDLTLPQAILRAPGFDINQIDSEGYTALGRAVKDGHDALVDRLLDAGADVSIQLPNKQTVLATAVKYGHRNIAQALYERVYPGPAQASPSEFQLGGLVARQDNGVSVYKAIYKGTAVVLKGPRNPNPRLATAMRHEIDEMQTCTSPYVLPLLAVLDNGSRDPLFTSDDGTALLFSPILVMDFMDGGDLLDALQMTRPGDNIPLGVSTIDAPSHVSAIDVALVLAYALADLHGLGKMHRDIKSLNIFLSSTHYIRLADLGSAKTLGAGLMTSNTGSHLWMAPEVVRIGLGGNGPGYGPPADIYSFGVVLAELDTREAPYADVSEQRLIPERVRTGSLRPKFSATCAPWLKALANECLEQDPTERPTAEDVIATLLAHRHEGASVQPSTQRATTEEADGTKAA